MTFMFKALRLALHKQPDSVTDTMPTSPFSPHKVVGPDNSTKNTLLSTVNVLDSLVAFYQHKRMWVYQSSAALQQAFSLPQSNSSSVDNRTCQDNTSPHKQYPTRWTSRKQEFKLRLEGIRSQRIINTHPIPQSEQLKSREQILSMFENMMETRMESCQRVRRLVQDASRVHR